MRGEPHRYLKGKQDRFVHVRRLVSPPIKVILVSQSSLQDNCAHLVANGGT
jgi:hypothetical protein